MDPIVPIENLQDVENEAGQVLTDCMGTPVILREIFHHFSTSELVQLSLVNKMWNYEARSLLRDRGGLTAKLECSPKSRARISAFASDLRPMNVNPFSGISLDVGLDNREWRSTSSHRCRRSSTNFEPVYKKILESLQLRHVSLGFYGSWSECCREFILAKKIMEKFSPILEEFSLSLAYGHSKFLHEFLRDFNFPRLKIFKLRSSARVTNLFEDSTDLIRAIVSHAPNLQVFDTRLKVNLSRNLLEGSSAVHKTDCRYDPYIDVPESVIGELRMNELILNSFSSDFSLERFNRVIPRLLQASRTTLTSVSIDDHFLAPLMLYGICLENVNTLWITFNLARNYQEAVPGVWRIAKSFDFTRLFPNVNTVGIYWETVTSHYAYNNEPRVPEEFHQVLQQANAELLEPMPDRAAKIKGISTIVLTNSFCGPSFRKFLAETFPDVQKLSVSAINISSGGIWDSWQHLKQLDIILGGKPFSDVEHFDDVLCGIFPEEADELQERDEEYLQSVNIVPVMPSITRFKDLRTLRFVVGDSYYEHIKERLPDPEMLFSRVTGLTVFKRCPGLSVTVELKNKTVARALRHLKPYANVVLTNQPIKMDD